MSTTARDRVRSFRDAERYRLQPGDACFRDGDLRAVYVVVGVLAGDRVEVVSLRELGDKTIVNPDDLDDVLDAVNDGRLGTYAMDRSRLLPLPASADIDIDEVGR